MLKNVLKVLTIFFIGALGGIWATQILWPYLVGRPFFYREGFEGGPVYIEEKKEVIIQENVALQNAVEKVKDMVVGVEAIAQNGETYSGNGFFVTADGLLITLNDLLPVGAKFYFWSRDRWLTYQILKRDVANNLALIKIEGNGFRVSSFGDYGKIKLGERIFAVAVKFSTSTSTPPVNLMVNEGIVKSLDENLIRSNISEETAFSGSPIFDIEGNVLGISLVKEKGEITAISIKKIREFLGF